MNRFGRRKEKRGTHTTLKSCSVWLLRRKTENLCKAAWKTMSPWDHQRRKRRKHDEILCVEGSLRQSRSSSGYSTITFDEKGGYYFSDPFPIIPSSLCIFYFYSQRLESTLSLAVSVHDFDYKEFFWQSHVSGRSFRTGHLVEIICCCIESLLGVWVSVDKPDYSTDCLLQGADCKDELTSPK